MGFLYLSGFAVYIEFLSINDLYHASFKNPMNYNHTINFNVSLHHNIDVKHDMYLTLSDVPYHNIDALHITYLSVPYTSCVVYKFMSNYNIPNLQMALYIVSDWVKTSIY